MAATVTKSLLLSKLGNTFVEAHNKNKGAAPRQDNGGDLPVIPAGVARLVQCKIMEIAKGKKNEGKLMFYAAATVLAPEYVDGFKVRGKFTRITEPIYDTPTRTRKTVNDHIKWIYETLENLGMRTKDLTPDRVEDAIKALLIKKPTFEFRTWKGPKQTTGPYAGREPMLNHVWGALTDWKPPTPTNGMKDGTEDVKPEDVPLPPDEPHDEYTAAPTEQAAETSGPSAFERTIGTEQSQNGNQTQVPDGAIPDSEYRDDADIDSLAKRAEESGDLGASIDLQQQALALGLTQDEINSAKSWFEVVEMMKAKQQEGGITISVGDHWMYSPINAATKQKLPARTVEITVINDNDTVDLKDVQVPRIQYKNISLNDLEPVK